MIRSRICRVLVLAALLCAGLFAAANGADAQLKKPEKTPYSEAEKIGFAFYRLADRTPPFNNWIMQKDEYLLAKPSAKREYMRRETERLTRAYGEYTMDEDLIFLRTEVRVKVPNKTELASYEQMGLRKPIQIELTEIKENYFPVQVGEMWVAVVANKLEDYLFLSLDEPEYDRIASELALDSKGSSRPALLEIRLHPTKIDMSQPMPLDGIEAWLMLGEIASISLWKNKDRDNLVWEKNMDWYVPTQQKELIDLYSR